MLYQTNKISTKTINHQSLLKMNRNNNINFCKVCQDAGKPESVYRSHNVKAANGVVTCPTLKALECRYCAQKGHTTKYCATLKNKDKQQQAKPVKSVFATPVPNKKVPAPSNIFDTLNNESSDEEEDNIVLPMPILKRETNILGGYAAALAIPQAAVEKKPIIALTAPKPVINANFVFKRSWADDWSSDEEDL